MAHTHNADCERLHDTLESLIAQLDTMSVGAGALPDGSILPPVAPDMSTADQDLPPIATQSSGAPDDGKLEMEIAEVRHALAVMGCDRS